MYFASSSICLISVFIKKNNYTPSACSDSTGDVLNAPMYIFIPSLCMLLKWEEHIDRVRAKEKGVLNTIKVLAGEH